TGLPVGTRDRIADFESQEFVKGVRNGHVLFDYHARHRELLEDLTPEDVVWTCGMLARLTDKQWSDAFRAGGYPDDLALRFIRKIKQKIQQGVALGAPGGDKHG